jgi:hypothetical protein
VSLTPALRLREAGNDQVSTIAYLFRIVLLSEDIEEVVAGADLDFSVAALFAGCVYRVLCPGSLYLLVILTIILRVHALGCMGTNAGGRFETATCSPLNKPLTVAYTALILFP